MSIGSNIKELREKNGLSQEALGKIAGVTDKAVSTWENDLKIPRMGAIQKIADYFGITKSELIEDHPEAAPEEPEDAAGDGFVNVPFYGDVAAGLGCYADNTVTDYVPFSASSLKKGFDYICLEVRGDSMYPLLLEGDLLLVQCRDDVKDGALAVMTVGGDEGVVKKLRYGQDWVELDSINPMYPPRRFEGAAAESVRVVGLVVECKRMFS